MKNPWNKNPPSLGTCCAALLGRRLDKRAQCSDWARRPLSPGQVEYAALDAVVLLRLQARLEEEVGDELVEELEGELSIN